MKKDRFSEYQIIGILRSVESGRLVKDVCREHAIAESTYFKWRSKYGGMEALDMKRLKFLEEENNLLKRMFADLSLETRALKDLFANLSKTLWRPMRQLSNTGNLVESIK